MPLAARLFIASIGLAGIAAVALILQGWTPELRMRFVVYLVLALASSGMKVVFPGLQGTFSLIFVLIMLGVTELTPAETVFLAIASAAAQTYWHGKGKVKLVHLFFNTTSLVLAARAATWVYHKTWFASVPEGEFLRLTLAGTAFFLVNI